MFRRLSPILATLVLLIFASSIAHAQSRSIVWDRWDVVIEEVDTTQNTFVVNEIYDIRFFGTFRFGQAVIPLDRVERIDNVQVYQNGQPLRQGCNGQAGTYCVQNTVEGLSIVYNFTSPITNDVANFVLQYRVTGALRIYPDGDQLWWIGVTSEKYGYPVNSSTIRVELPPEYAPRADIDPVVTYGVDATVDVQGSTVIAQAQRQIEPDEAFEIRAQYPHNPDARVAYWQASFDEQRAFDETVRPWVDIGALLGGFVLAVLGTFFTYYRWFTRGRDPKIGPVPEYLSEPPAQLPPALVGTLVDENAELRDIVSTLVDLADRGYVIIEEGERGKFTFLRTEQPADGLRAYEKFFIEKLFGRKDSTTLSELRNKFYVHIPRLQEMVYDELVSEGMFKESPQRVRNGWMALAMVILFGGIGLVAIMFPIVETLSYSLMCLPASLVVTGVAMLLAASAMPSKSQKGAEEAAKWRAFREYMQNLQRYQEVEAAAQNFSRYLPYAVAFGFDRSWIRRFAKLDTVEAPPWYWPRSYRQRRGVWTWGGGSTVGGGPFTPSASDVRPGDISRAGGGGLDDLSGGLGSGLESISDGLTRMLNSASSTMNSRPQAQSGSSGSWGGGGRSFSGGGSFGGGGGGGGSRGFG